MFGLLDTTEVQVLMLLVVRALRGSLICVRTLTAIAAGILKALCCQASLGLNRGTRTRAPREGSALVLGQKAEGLAATQPTHQCHLHVSDERCRGGGMRSWLILMGQASSAKHNMWKKCYWN
jgi:hypothetical protein